MKPALAALMLAAVVEAAPEWRRIASPRFELLTDASERAGRDAIERFEQVRHVFATLSGVGSPPLPIRVYLFTSEAEFRRYRPSANVRGFYQSGPDRDYIAMAAGPEIYRVAFHEYVHLVLNHSTGPLAGWIEEGTAEFFSTMETGRRLRIGGVIPEHIVTLNRHKWLDAATLLDVTKNSSYYNEREKAGIFYAQSWALVHMLYTSPAYRDNVVILARLLDEGLPQEAALERAFGKPAAALLAELQGYVGARRFPTLEIPWDPPPAVQVSAAVISDEEADLVRAELLSRTGRPQFAEEQLRRRLAEGRATPEVHAALGELELSRKRFAQARRHFESAIAAGAGRASTYFEYAMLLRDTGGDRAVVESNLWKVVELNPAHAEAHFLLALAASGRGRHAEAIPLLRRAVEILPRQSYFWHALALACHQTGDRDQARRAARRARDAAGNAHEREMAEAAVRLVETAVTANQPGGSGPGVHTPSQWFDRKGDSRVEGTLERVDCLGASARLQVRSGGRLYSLRVADPRKVVMRGAGAVEFQFACGPQKPRPVVVEYMKKGDADGEATAIELR